MMRLFVDQRRYISSFLVLGTFLQFFGGSCLKAQGNMVATSGSPGPQLEFGQIQSPQYTGVVFTNQVRLTAPDGAPWTSATSINVWIVAGGETNLAASRTIFGGEANLAIIPPVAGNAARLITDFGEGAGSLPFNVLPSFPQTIPHPVGDIARIGETLFGLVPDEGGQFAGNIVTIAPENGTIEAWAAVPGGLTNSTRYGGRIIASADGEWLFAAGGNGTEIQVWNVQTKALAKSYSLPNGEIVADIAATRAAPWRLGVPAMRSNGGSVSAFLLDETLWRTSTSRNLRSIIAHPDEAETFFGFGPYQISQWHTGPDGILSDFNVREGPYRDVFLPMVAIEGRLFAADGGVSDIATGEFLGQLPVEQNLAAAPHTALITSDPVRKEVLIASSHSAGATRLQSFGAETLEPRREILVPISLASPRRMLFCGSNTVAIVASNHLHFVRWPAVPSGAGTVNLKLNASSSDTKPSIGSDWQWTVTITNLGPSTATDVRVMYGVPPGIVITEAKLESGSSTLKGNFLELWTPEIAVGGMATIRLTLRPQRGGTITNRFTAIANEDDEDLADNQAGGIEFIHPSNEPESVSPMHLGLKELVYDSRRDRIYALQAGGQAGETRLYSLDPLLLEPELLRVLAGTAYHLRISLDQRYLYTSIENGRSIQRIDLAGDAADLIFEAFSVEPGIDFRLLEIEPDHTDSKNLFAIASIELPSGSEFETVILRFDDGAKAPRTVSFLQRSSSPVSGANLEISPASSEIIAAVDSSPDRPVGVLRSVADGVELLNVYSYGGLAGGFELVHDRLYSWSGDEVNPATGKLLRKLPLSSPSVIGINHIPATDRLSLLKWGANGQLLVFDRETFALVGSIPVGATGFITSQIVVGEDRIAFTDDAGHLYIVKTSLISGSSPADLKIEMGLNPLLPGLGEPVELTITLTNLGPAEAVAPGTTLLMPPWFSRESVDPKQAPDSGSTLSPYPLLWTNTTVPPGESRVFKVRGRFTASGTMQIVAGVADRAIDAVPQNNVAEITLAVVHSLQRGQGAQLGVTVLDAIYDPGRQAILGIAAPDDPRAGRLVAISIATGTELGAWEIGSNPSKLALADDNQTLYVITDAGLSIARVDLQSMQTLSMLPVVPDQPAFPLQALDLAVNPGSPEQVVALRSDGMLALYGTDGVQSATEAPFGDFAFTGPNRLAALAPGSLNGILLFEIIDDTIRSLAIGGPPYIEGLRAGGGHIFATDGRLINPETLELAGRFSASGPAAFRSPGGLVFFSVHSAFPGLKAFDLHTQTLVLEELFPGLPPASGLSDLFLAGGDYLAQIRNGRAIVLRSKAIPLLPSTDLAVSIDSASPWKAGAVCEWTVRVTNEGMAAVYGATLQLRLPEGMLFVGPWDRLISTEGVHVNLQIGALQPGQTAGLTVRAVAQAASFAAELVASVRSEKLDREPANNVARWIQPIESSQLPNRVDSLWIPAVDLLYESFSERLYLACVERPDGRSNVLVVMDPARGVIEQEFELPGFPGRLAASDDGEYLYVSLDNGAEVLRLKLPSMEADLQFETLRDDSVLPRPETDMFAVPGQPSSLVLSRFGGGYPVAGGIWVYDDGVPRPGFIPGGHGSIARISPGPEADVFVGRDEATGRFRRITIDESGLTAQSPAGTSPLLTYGGFAAAGSNILVGSEVFDQNTFELRGSLPVPFDPQAGAISRSGDRIVLASGSNRSERPVDIAGFRTDSLAITGTAQTGVTSVYVQQVELWGTEGIAILADGFLLLGRLDIVGPAIADADADGLPDAWESAYQLDPMASDAGSDPDLDGASNLAEYLAGTNPSSPDSAPRLDLAILSDTKVRMIFPCASGRRYIIERSSNLSLKRWTEVFQGFSSGGIQVHDQSVSGGKQGYFRIRFEAE